MAMGYVHVYFGDGPGKTTAAMGLALRGSGQGLRVAVAQFLKDNSSGERRMLKKLPGITLLPAPASLPFTFAMTPAQKTEYHTFVHTLWEQILTLLQQEAIDLLILDEWGDACEQGWFSAEDADRLWEAAGPAELVITTHGLPAFLLERADYLTEMKKLCHPYDHGLCARRGIEY